jgi:poly(hydroxyalkanoate) depolymerase family esterase
MRSPIASTKSVHTGEHPPLKPFIVPRPAPPLSRACIDPARSSRPFDTAAIVETIERALDSAGLGKFNARMQTPMQSTAETIHQALSAAGLKPAGSAANLRTFDHDGGVSALDICPQRVAPGALLRDIAEEGRFIPGSFSNAAGARNYKLYVPVRYSPEAADAFPMVVMLHGCTQSPDDFATGTRMNALAEQHNFLVLYPEQSNAANVQRCWNWFRPGDQDRDHGEPSIIADMTHHVASTYRIDRGRIFVAGMSAGAAMAVVLGHTYPDLYAGVGAHSGLPYRCAHDVVSALSAMKGGKAAATGSRLAEKQCVRTISFHGDRDVTVHRANGTEIIRRAIGACVPQEALVRVVEESEAPGRRYTRTSHADAAGRPLAEEWVIHSAGHAWSGGSAKGSFTDATGPDASAEMIRFFLSLPMLA